MPEVKLLSWTGVVFIDQDDQLVCSICKLPADFQCPQCEDTPCSECSKVFCQCGQCYHRHCISSWVQQQQTCPLCQRPWTE